MNTMEEFDCLVDRKPRQNKKQKGKRLDALAKLDHKQKVAHKRQRQAALVRECSEWEED